MKDEEEAEETMREKFQKGEITIFGRTCKQLYELLYKNHELEKENMQLKAQNKKMKCCGNCKHVEYDFNDQLRIGKCKTCKGFSNWELKE